MVSCSASSASGGRQRSRFCESQTGTELMSSSRRQIELEEPLTYFEQAGRSEVMRTVCSTGEMLVKKVYVAYVIPSRTVSGWVKVMLKRGSLTTMVCGTTARSGKPASFVSAL